MAGGGGEDGEGGAPEAGGRRDVGCGGGEDERGRGAGGKEAAEGEVVEAERGVRPVAEEEEHGGGGGGREGGGDGDRREVGPLGLGAVGGERGGCSDCVWMGSVHEELGRGVGGGVSAACAGGGGGHGETKTKGTRSGRLGLWAGRARRARRAGEGAKQLAYL